MKRGVLSRVLLFAGASATSTAACSLVLSIDDLDSKYGATGGSKGTSSSSGTGGAATSSSTTSASTASVAATSSSTASASASSTSSSSGCGPTNTLTNCGACGFACPPNSTCDGTRCSAVSFGSANASTIACSAKFLYYAEPGTSELVQLPLDGGTTCTCPTATAPSYVGIGAGSDAVAWSVASSGGWDIQVASEEAFCTGSCAPLTVGHATSTPQTYLGASIGGGVTTDATNVYWLDDAHAWQVARDGGAPLSLFDAAPGGPSGLAVADPFVYVTQGQTRGVFIARVGVGQASTLEPDFSRGVQANSAFIVWDDDTNGYIDVYSNAAATSYSLEPQALYARGLALDDQYVYAGYDVDGGSTLSRWELDAGSSAAAATLETSTQGIDFVQICQSGDFLYWINGSGQIMKGDKRP